jgi:arsenate reductase
LYLVDAPNEAELIQAVVAHPILVERPIVINGGLAAIGRPPEAVLDIS